MKGKTNNNGEDIHIISGIAIRIKEVSGETNGLLSISTYS